MCIVRETSVGIHTYMDVASESFQLFFQSLKMLLWFVTFIT